MAMAATTVTAVLIPVNGPVRAVEVESTELSAWQDLVGGDIEGIGFEIGDTYVSAYINEDGKIAKLPRNTRATQMTCNAIQYGDYIAGDMVILGDTDDEGYHLSVAPELVAQLVTADALTVDPVASEPAVTDRDRTRIGRWALGTVPGVETDSIRYAELAVYSHAGRGFVAEVRHVDVGGRFQRTSLFDREVVLTEACARYSAKRRDIVFARALQCLRERAALRDEAVCQFFRLATSK